MIQLKSGIPASLLRKPRKSSGDRRSSTPKAKKSGLKLERVFSDAALAPFDQVEWDIDGEIRLTKNDKLKKFFDFVGREKGGKPKKKVKDPNRKRLIEIKDMNAPSTPTLIAPPREK